MRLGCFVPRPSARRALLVAAVGLWIALARSIGAQSGVPAPPAEPDAAIGAILQRIEAVLKTGDPAQFDALLASSADRRQADTFAHEEIRPGATAVVLKERDRQMAGHPGQERTAVLVVDVMAEYGARARVATWRLNLIANPDWRVAEAERLSAVGPLFRLALDATHQFEATNLVVAAEDLELTLPHGAVFPIETAGQTTGLVLVGRGHVRFHPPSNTERRQVRIFSGADALASPFDTAYVRFGSLDAHLNRTTLAPRPVDSRAVRRAEDVFREQSVKSFLVDLGDLSAAAWSSAPQPDDFLAEIHTPRYDTLTYARSPDNPEDISLFDRRRRRNISVYASHATLASRGPFYDEDTLVPYDVLDNDIDLTVSPDVPRIDGVARVRLRVRAPSITQLPLKLAESLAVQSVTSDRFGRLFALRVPDQHLLLVNLPATVLRGTDLTLTIAYGGPLAPQPAARETMDLQQADAVRPLPPVPDEVPHLEPAWIYSNQSDWYPHAPVTDYATARLRIAVPAPYVCIATGAPSPHMPEHVADASGTRNIYTFTARQPVRYLAFAVSRFRIVERQTLTLDAPSAVTGERRSIDLVVETNASVALGARAAAERAADIYRYFHGLIDDAPYESLTIALVEQLQPGGHSPAYFAILNQPLPDSDLTWRDDPVAFADVPEFFLAHEIAHQWWGQAVGWRNYHEQWLSEAFAQYFAALYARHLHGDDTFTGVLRRMRQSSLDDSADGPVYLGYRVGHILGDSRAFRAIVYNKGALVLHMLRRLVGDEAFFAGLRRYYAAARFQKAGTEQFRAAMEAASGRSLERFFDRWIYESAVPVVRFSVREEGPTDARQAVLRFEQVGPVFDLPITVTLTVADRAPIDVVVPVTESTVEYRVPLAGRLRAVDVNKDEAALAIITKER